jgi:hypothetical protein
VLLGILHGIARKWCYPLFSIVIFVLPGAREGVATYEWLA